MSTLELSCIRPVMVVTQVTTLRSDIMSLIRVLFEGEVGRRHQRVDDAL